MTQPAPPPSWRLAYRLLGLRLPDEHRAWVAEDVAGKQFVNWRIARTTLWTVALVGIGYVVLGVVHEPPQRRTALRILLGLLVIPLLATRKSLVRRTLRWQRMDRHGRPVAPRRLALLENNEALVLGVAAVVLFSGCVAAYAHLALRPTSCRKPDEQTMRLLRAGLKSQDTEIRTPQALPFGREGQRSTMVGAFVKKTGDPTPALSFWIVQGETVYELRSSAQAGQSATTFEPPPASAIDRNGVSAVQTLATCLTRASR